LQTIFRSAPWSNSAILEPLPGAKTDPNALIGAMEGLKFETAKGQRTIRPEDHQALQEMYVCHLKVKSGYAWPVPILKKVISAADSAPPVMVKK
jgi:branched-chain amino acid transport system substrate-binding protein